MRIEILKCDRCKQKVNELIDFQFVNTNNPDDNDGDGEKGMMWPMLPKQKQYPTVQGGLCYDCIQIISRWLGHPENELIKNKVKK